MDSFTFKAQVGNAYTVGPVKRFDTHQSAFARSSFAVDNRPMRDMNFQGRRVLVTGASSGLGAKMAELLAREHRANLVLVARRQTRLEELSAQIKKDHGVEVEYIVADLSSTEEVSRVFSTATASDPLYAAVLNAGVTHFGHHDELSWDAFETMLNLNVRGTARLTKLMLPYLEKRGENGGVLLVASLAGTTPVAYQSAYSGTKAFIVSYGCSLHHEMKRRGVTVTTFAPGGIATEMTEGNRFNDLRAWLVPVEPCARAALMGLQRRRYLVVPGLMYRVGSVAARLLPQSLLVGQVASRYRKSLGKDD